MSDRGPVGTDAVRVRIGTAMGVFSSVVSVAAVVVLAIRGDWDFLIELPTVNFAGVGLGFGLLSWVMVRSQPRNGAVWTVAWTALFAALYTGGVAASVVLASGSYPDLSYEVMRALSPTELPVPAAIGIHFRFWTVVPVLWLPLTLGLLLFPSGHPPTPRWKWVGWWSVLCIAVATTVTAVSSGPWSTNPISSGEDTVAGWTGAVNDTAVLLVSISALVSLASLVVRYRRSAGVERSQIRWIGWGAGILIATLWIGSYFEAAGPGDLSGALIGLAAEGALIASYAIAITTYRLYDIDVIISRTVTYGILAALITGVYALIVVGIGTLIGGSGEPNLGLSIGAVVVVAVAFEPLRNRVQHWANRLVYGKRSTPYEVLATVTARLSATRDSDEALAGLTRLIVDGTGASEVVLWLVVGDQLYPRTATPSSAVDGLSPLPVADAPLDAVPGDSVVEVRHRGEVLGALSVTKSRGDAVTGADEKILADVAAGAGVLLRNIGLNAELADRAEQLRVSRRRLVAAQDAERHRLERDLHDGAQQQVVALKVKLGIARALAEREGADQVAALVASLADTTQEAVDRMRGVAHGIYPPLLEAEGLEAALNAAKRTIAVPVEIGVDGLRRYERSVEESVYFAVLGTVTQSVDRGATRAVISLSATDEAIRFSVDVDAASSDLVAVIDRIEAFNGTITIVDQEYGSVISGCLPAIDPALEPA